MTALKTKKPKSKLPSKPGKRKYTKVKAYYRSKGGMLFHIGDRVRLNEKALTQFNIGDMRYAHVENLLPDADGMVVLDRRLGGYHTWHVNELYRLGGKKKKYTLLEP